MNLVVSGLLTHYERVRPSNRAAKLVLIIPGWADTSVSWRQVQQELGRHYDVVVIDLPGFGGSEKPEATWGLDEYSEFINEFISKLNTGSIHAIVGHSNGGAIAIRGLGRGKLSTSRLILIASAGIRGQGTARKSLIKVITKAGKAISSPLPADMKSKLRKFIYRRAGSDMLVAEHMTDTFKKVIATDVRHDAAAIKLPTLLIYGDKDTDTPSSFGYIFASAITGSRMVVVPDAGHFLFLEKPSEIITEIKDFLND